MSQFFQPHPNVAEHLVDDCGEVYTEHCSRDGSYPARCVLRRGHSGHHSAWEAPWIRARRRRDAVASPKQETA